MTFAIETLAQPNGIAILFCPGFYDTEIKKKVDILMNDPSITRILLVYNYLESYFYLAVLDKKTEVISYLHGGEVPNEQLLQDSTNYIDTVGFQVEFFEKLNLHCAGYHIFSFASNFLSEGTVEFKKLLECDPIKPNISHKFHSFWENEETSNLYREIYCKHKQNRHLSVLPDKDCIVCQIDFRLEEDDETQDQEVQEYFTQQNEDGSEDTMEEIDISDITEIEREKSSEDRQR